MTIDEAIQHCEEVADTPCFTDEETRCYSEHQQLAEWLKELKAYREQRGDAISRQSAIFLASDLKQDLPDDERIADMVMAHNEGILEYQTQLSLLPPVTPQQRTGRWIAVENEEMKTVGYYCSECDLPMETENQTRFCPNCGTKMEV